MARINPITPLGWEIRKRLAERRLTQREFCEKYDIPQNRLTEIISGTRKARKYRQRIKEVLGIDIDDFPESIAK